MSTILVTGGGGFVGHHLCRRLVADGRTLSGPLAISNYAVRARLTGAVAVARGAGYELWRPLGTPRMAMFVGGLYQDGWLANGGHITLWPAGDGRVDGTLTLPLSLPQGTRRTVLQLSGPGEVWLDNAKLYDLLFPLSFYSNAQPEIFELYKQIHAAKSAFDSRQTLRAFSISTGPPHSHSTRTGLPPARSAISCIRSPK